MKKFLILILAVALLTLSAGTAMAAVQWVHGNFATNSSGCAQCHVTHAANVASLLKLTSGTNTQSTFCVQCHSMGAGSPYDVDKGIILKTGVGEDADGYIAGWGTVANRVYSYAGGFQKSWDFVSGTMKDTTSVHGVENYDLADASHFMTMGGTGVLTAATVPGGADLTASGTFKCGSCHDPHAGGPSAPNPRLLKVVLPADSTGRYVYFENADSTSWDSNGIRRETAYGKGWNEWCGGCHNVFASAGDRAGHDTAQSSKNPNSKYMHAMGIVVNTVAGDGVATDMGTGTPVAAGSTGNKELLCVSCHKAHGTSAYMDSNADSFVRYDGSYQDNTGTTHSVLLRLDNRDVCYKCHGAATKNTYTLW